MEESVRVEFMAEVKAEEEISISGGGWKVIGMEGH